MKHIILVFSILFVAAAAYAQQVRVAAAYTYPLLPGSAQDSVLRGLSSIRGCSFATDVDGDGKSEIAVTNYNSGGRVHVFEAVGNDSIALVWTSPSLGRNSAYATPRTVLFGDLDNDGRKEVICDVSGVGIVIFEWDGVMGSDNYGSAPSFVIGPPYLNGGAYVEYMEVADVDGDNENEILVAWRAQNATDQRYAIMSVAGDWSTNDPGFTSVNVEYVGSRNDLGTYGLGGGSPVAMFAANFDGVGNKEILIHNWNIKNVVPMTVPAANTYLLADTTHGKQNAKLGGETDDVALLGGLVCDIDNDGREEVYLPTWYGSNSASPNAGKVHMVFYDPASNLREIDTAANVRTLDLTPSIGLPDASLSYSSNLLGYGYGDLDGNGKTNLYFSGICFGQIGFNIVSMEFQGGDKRVPANWVSSVIYSGDASVLASMTIKDSAGVRDTTRTRWAAQVAKLYARNTDFDKDGKQDILLPFQGWYGDPDSIAITKYTWNTSGARYDTANSKIINPKRWTFRVLEATGTTGVEMKEITTILPDDYTLDQNYPNPFNPSTTIRFSLPLEKKVSLVVYDILGKEVKTLINDQSYVKGTHEVVWDGTNNGNKRVASGTYLYTLKFGSFSKSAKMTLLK